MSIFAEIKIFMSQIVFQFIELVKRRSEENKLSLNKLYENRLFGNCISILRQEVDTFIRIIYLGRLNSVQERERLISLTFNDEKWNTLTVNSKMKIITDKDMVDIASEVKGYVQYLYKFGCGFIHLSNFHNYQNENPFGKLKLNEQIDIKFYLHQYHGFPIENNLTIESIENLIPKIFDKISQNMLYYNEQLLNNESIDF
jgi:hypothetical protein